MIEVMNSAAQPVRLWTPLVGIESSAIDQLRNVAALPNVVGLCAMPDVHAGVGATVGSVIALENAVIPAAVGVDIACGMCAVRTNLTQVDIPADRSGLRKMIEDVVPTGNGPGGSHNKKNDGLSNRLYREKNNYKKFWDRFSSLTKEVHPFEASALHQIGTLGGGNHFIELCFDTEGKVWIMLHSGSRRIGKEIADVYVKRAKALHKGDRAIPDPNLAYLSVGTPDFEGYIHDASWAQEYAAWNRLLMLTAVQDVMAREFPQVVFEDAINCHHNFFEEVSGESVGREGRVFITRKGAISAQAGQKAIIPGSMGTRSYIVEGLGNPDSFFSASHGAGRKMSRTEAKRTFTADDVLTQTAGVECRKDTAIIDELPGAYKDIDQVMEYQKDLVRPLYTLKQFLCIKG